MADRELGWNDPIENDGSDFTVLQAGEYNFKVTKFERKRWAGSAKLPACPQAELYLELFDDDGRTVKQEQTRSLFLHTKCEGFLAEFFRSIGARKHGEKMVMDWSKVTGATGRCEIAIKKIDSKKNPGTQVEVNEVKKFLDPPTPEDKAEAKFEPGNF